MTGHRRPPDLDALVDAAAFRRYYPEIPASTVRWWAHTGRITRHGVDGHGRVLYRVGDLLAAVAHRRADTPTRRSA